MDPRQHRCVLVPFADGQSDVLSRVHQTAVGDGFELAKFGGQPGFSHFFDQFLVVVSVGDYLSDTENLKVVALGELPYSPQSY